MVLIVSDHAAERPEVTVDIKEVHINGYLNTFSFQVFFFINLIHDYDFPVCYRGYQSLIMSIRNRSVRNPEKPGNEEHEKDQEQGNGKRYPGIVDKMADDPDEDGTDAPADKDCHVGVAVNFNPMHNGEIIRVRE